jgi:ABC-type uncharacterized transport system auxiliary subunit
MRNRPIESYICLGVLAASLTVVGCGPKPYNKRHYYLAVDRPYETARADNELVLEVRTFTIDSAFDSKGLVYRKDEFEYESDFYNEFLVWPAMMITEKTRTWLLQTGLFARVLDGASHLQPTHTMEANITALYGDFREGVAPAAAMEISFFLIENDPTEESLIWAKAYKGSCEMSTRTPKALVEAFDRCLANTLLELEKDLALKLPLKSTPRQYKTVGQ